MGDIETALESLKSLKIGEKPNYKQTAKKYGVSRTTLRRRHRGLQGTQKEKWEKQRLLNATQEKELVRYVEKLCSRGLPPSKSMIHNFAAEIAKQEPGKCWVDRFLERHKIDLISRWTTGIDSLRHRADSTAKYHGYFELLRRKIEQYNIEPQHTYNMDEKGFLIGILGKMKRIFSRRFYEEGGMKQMLQDGNREWITTIACICADGTSLPPALVYEAVSGNVQDSWLQDFDHDKHKAFFTSSPSGWTNNEIGLAWLKQVFDRETKPKAKRAYRLLILDGHGSHISIKFIDYCDKNRILLAVYPPHSTHTLQPLDVGMFKPLSTAYKEELSSFMNKCQGLTSITKRDFFRLFYKAWGDSFIEENIFKAFKSTGLSPFDPEVVLKSLRVRETDRPSSGGSAVSGTSVLSASDWRTVRRLLREATEASSQQMTQEVTQQLTQHFHSISAQFSLLKHEVEGYKEALVNEKKKRQRGKALKLEKPEEYNGGAVFWSPTKVKAARERQEQKEAEEKVNQQKKDEETQRREQKKKEKALMLEERRRLRLEAKEARLREQQQKAVAREEAKIAREVEKQLKDDIKSSKKGKRRSPKLPKEPESVDADISSIIDEVPVTVLSRRGREIKQPERYRT